MKSIFTYTILFLSVLVSAQVKSFKNGNLWKDTNGKVVQAHGMHTIKHNGLYYMVGEDRTKAFTFTGVNLYSSTDLMNWKFVNAIVDVNANPELGRGERIIERPCLLYNAKNNQFVLWVKYQNGAYTNNKAAIFYSNTIDGKYTYLKEFFPGGYDSNDDGIFIDTDGSAYYTSTCKGQKSLNLYKLNSDYFDVASSTVLFKDQNREAPVIFKKDDVYYFLSSSKTGWDPNPLKYCTSKSLTSGWTAWKTIGDKISYDSQPTECWKITGTEGTSYFYVGDRWQDPKLPESKTVVYPLTVDSKNSTLNIEYVYEFKIDLVKGTWKAFDDNSYIPQNNWKLISSTGEIKGDNTAEKAFDNNLNTIWETSSATTTTPEIAIDLGTAQTVTGFKFIQRKDDNNTDGKILKDYKLYLSNDKANWGNPVAQGRISYTAEILFNAKTARYMRFVSQSEYANNIVSAAELKLIGNSTLSADTFINQKNKLTVLPNPSKSGIFKLNKETSWEIWSLTGAKLDHGYGDVINIENSSTGLYFLKTDFDNVTLIKQD